MSRRRSESSYAKAVAAQKQLDAEYANKVRTTSETDITVSEGGTPHHNKPRVTRRKPV